MPKSVAALINPISEPHTYRIHDELKWSANFEGMLSEVRLFLAQRNSVLKLFEGKFYGSAEQDLCHRTCCKWLEELGNAASVELTQLPRFLNKANSNTYN